MKGIKNALLRDFKEFCKNNEVKHEFTQLMKPVIQFLFQELYPYICLSLLFIIICFILLLLIFMILMYKFVFEH